MFHVKAAGWDVWPRCTPAPWSHSRPPCTFPPQLPQVRFNKHVVWREFNWIYFGFVLDIISQILTFLLFFLFQRWRPSAGQTCKRGDGASWVVEVKMSKSGFEKIRNLKTSLCHCGERGNMFFSPNMTDISAQYRGQMICSLNAHLHFNALVENNSAYIPKCIFKSSSQLQVSSSSLPLTCSLQALYCSLFSPVLFKVLKSDLRSFQANWWFRGTLSEIKKWYTVHRFASLLVVKFLWKMRKSFHINISFQRIIRFLFASIDEVYR